MTDKLIERIEQQLSAIITSGNGDVSERTLRQYGQRLVDEGDIRALIARVKGLETRGVAYAKLREAILAERVAENDWRKAVESRERWMTYRFECTDSEWLEFQ